MRNDIQRLIVDLYRYCDILDYVYFDDKPNFDDFHDFLRSFERNIEFRTKETISSDLRKILDNYVKEGNSNYDN